MRRDINVVILHNLTILLKQAAD